MSKKKSVQERLRQYYRGPKREPTKVANNKEMAIITDVLTQCAPHRSKSAFKIVWNNEEIQVKLVVGLKATLRHLKLKETIAMVLDDSSPFLVEKLLSELANKASVPILKARDLIKLAPQLKLNTIQAFSIIDTARVEKRIYDVGQPRPRPVESVMEIEPLHKLVTLLQVISTALSGDKYTFRDPQIDQVRSTGKSRLKKEAKKAAKESVKEIVK